MQKLKKTKKVIDRTRVVKTWLIFSLAINFGFVAFLLIAWAAWDNGSLNDNQIQTSLCHNFYKSVQSGMYMDGITNGTKTTVGNVTFVNTYVNPALLNSPCWLESQALNFAHLTQINNSAATTYYTNQTNFHAPANTSQYLIPIYINSKTKKPTVFPY